MTKEDIRNIIQVIGIKNIVIYFIVINLIGFLAMFIDKQKAKKGRWRIPEKTLFTITLLGGGIGTNLGMKMFRHKTKKGRFMLGFPTILIVEIGLIIALIVYLYA